MRTPARSARSARPAALAGLALVAALAVSGCSSDDDTDSTGSSTSPAPAPSASDDPTPSEPASSAAPSSAAPASNLPAACETITEGDIAKMMGISVGAGQAERGDDDDAGVAWTTSECSFSSPEVEVTVKLTGPADVTKGTFGCPQPDDSDGNVEPADDVAGATKGWWRTNAAPPLEAELRACSAEANVDIGLDYEINDYEGDPRQQAADLAAFVLANIQG
ncbi:hypothetical protein [Nocardioides sp.]|uniref:hypothetical protein n=1 Tax=Nocardioides sp. TaxID=35761 RepID=UPI003515085B